MVSYKAKEKQRREQEIITQAKNLLLEKGYASLTMEELAETVGISKPTLYQHFKSKDELVEQVFLQDHQYFDEQTEHLKHARPIEQILGMMRAMLRRRYAARSVILALGPEVIHILKNSPLIQQRWQHNREHFMGLIDAAKAEGDLNPAIETPIIAGAMFSLLGSLGGHFALPVIHTEDTLDEAIEQVVHIFMKGVSPSSAS